MQLEVGVCADELDECPDGEYEVEFQVQNGLCYDEDNTFVRFYEQPEANAGIDQVLCNTFSFTLTATPYEYCGEEGVNYWPTRYWEFFSSVDPNAQVTFFPDEFASEVFVTITTVAECPFGTYTFAWHEENSKYEDEGCLDVAYVNITVIESPEVDAGADLYFCDTFEFTLDGTLDMQCNTAHAYTYSWELIDQPDMCEVSIAELTADPLVSITNCSPCEYGEYIFKFTQQNGYGL